MFDSHLLIFLSLYPFFLKLSASVRSSRRADVTGRSRGALAIFERIFDTEVKRLPSVSEHVFLSDEQSEGRNKLPCMYCTHVAERECTKSVDEAYACH